MRIMDTENDLKSEDETGNDIRNIRNSSETDEIESTLHQNQSQSTDGESVPSPHIMKSRRRKVHFPEGDKIISERIPPPNPWKNVGDVSTEELVAAYHAACAFNQVKPSTTIIRQLEKMRDPSVRVDSFNFKGEKIDSRTAESLEEIFRRVQFKSLDIEGCSLEDEAAVALFEMVEFYESAVKMSMSSVKGIGFRGWQAASKMMRKSSCLEILDISRTSWSEHSVPILCRAVRADTCLVALHLEACNLAGRPLVLLMSALRMNLGIRELFLADNRLMPSDAFHIGGMLKHNAGLKLLDLRNNNMQDVGVNHISDGLAGQMRGRLNTLVLWNNHITHVGAGHLGKTLPMITSLETLNIGQNNFGIEGIMKLKEGLMKNKFLQRLGLFSCRVNDEGAIALAEYLADNCQLIRLDLRENEIRTGGLMALSRSLNLNKVLLRLDIDKSIKKENLNGHAELQQQFLDDIEQMLLSNRQYLEANSLQPKYTSEEQPSPQMTSRQVSDPGGTPGGGTGTPSPVDTTSRNGQADDQCTDPVEIPVNIVAAVKSPVDDLPLEDQLSPEISGAESLDTAILEDGRLLEDNPQLRGGDKNGDDDSGGLVSSPLGATDNGIGSTRRVLERDILTVSTDTRSESGDVTSSVSVASSGITSGGVTAHYSSASSSMVLESASNNLPSSSGLGNSRNPQGMEGGPSPSVSQEIEPQSTFSGQSLPGELNVRTENDITTHTSQGKSVEDRVTLNDGDMLDSTEEANRVGGSRESEALHRVSPPGIRINENIKLLTVANHMIDAEQGLDPEGQELMASAIDDGLPGNKGDDTAIEDGSDKPLSTNGKTVHPTPPIVSLHDSQS